MVYSPDSLDCLERKVELGDRETLRVVNILLAFMEKSRK
jgi:hypothetical protein